jgi:hypothetical protein
MRLFGIFRGCVMISTNGQTPSGAVVLTGRTLRDIEESADLRGCVRYVLWGEVFRKLAGEWVCVGEAATGTTGKGDRRSASRFRKHNASNEPCSKAE